MHPNVHRSTIYNSQVLEVSEWIRKLWNIYTMEYYAAERKKELLFLGTAWMELENIMLNEISQEVNDKYRMVSPIRGT